MKKHILLISAAGILLVGASACGPIVAGGPDVVVGGGIYPAPIPVPPPGPNVFRPGAPYGPGFQPGPGPANPGGRIPGGGVPGLGNPNGPGGPGGMGGPGGPGGPGGGPGGPGGPIAD